MKQAMEVLMKQQLNLLGYSETGHFIYSQQTNSVWSTIPILYSTLYSNYPWSIFIRRQHLAIIKCQTICSDPICRGALLFSILIKLL